MTCSSIAQRAELFRIVCAWCQTVLAEGPAGARTSHGMCDECLEKAFSHQTETEALIDAAASRE